MSELMHLLTSREFSGILRSMKTTKCRNCDGKGNVHIDIPSACDRVFDLPCWICGGFNFKGMNREQAAWFLKVHKALETLKGKSLRAGECVAPQSWLTIKNAIDKACGRLGIALQTIAYPKAVHYGETNAGLHMREEFKEYERRLLQVPIVLAAKVVA